MGCEESEPSFKVGFFKIAPAKLTFNRSVELKIMVEFIPETKGVFSEKIKYKTFEGDQE